MLRVRTAVAVEHVQLYHLCSDLQTPVHDSVQQVVLEVTYREPPVFLLQDVLKVLAHKRVQKKLRGHRHGLARTIVRVQQLHLYCDSAADVLAGGLVYTMLGLLAFVGGDQVLTLVYYTLPGAFYRDRKGLVGGLRD